MEGLIGRKSGRAERLRKKMINRWKQQEMERKKEVMERHLVLEENQKQWYMKMAAQRQQLEEFQKRMKAQKERRENNGNEGLGSTSTPSNSGTAQGNMEEEAFISSVIQKLYFQHVELCERSGDVESIEGIINELRMILNFLRGKTCGEELKNLICKVMETALHLDNIMETADGPVYYIDANSVRCRLRRIKMQMIKSGGDGEEKEAIILSVIQKLEHHHVEAIDDELRMILDYLREKTREDLGRLDCLICEAVEMSLYLDLIVGTFDIRKETRTLKSRLQGIKLRMLRYGVDGEDAETLILLVIQKFDAKHLELELIKFVGDIKGVMDELRMILDFLREEKEKTDLINLRRKRRHKYLICDLIEMALYLYNIEDTDDMYRDLFVETQSRLREIRLRMHMLKSETGSEDVGEGDEKEDDVVGLHEQVRLVLGRGIFNEAKGLETAVITGMVGVGKTSLARQVYNHATVVDHFERRAWACVSTHSTHKEILMKLIQQVVVMVDKDSSLKLEEMDNLSLRHLLHQHLQGIPYLIVLDDLPKLLHLKSLLNAFPRDEDKGSRLLVTCGTRNIETTICYTHVAKPLDSDNSWKLFLNTIFRGIEFSSEQKTPKHLEKKGKEMLRKCGGLPLVIKEVALQLAEQRRRGSEWEQLLDSIDWGATLALLENFYKQLDEEQRSCFLHLALFKENTTIRADKILDVMVAGGLASESEIVTYFTKLNSEFIIEFKHSTGRGNRIKSCDTNVVLHKLSIKKAEKEIGFEILSDKNANNPPSQTSPRHRIINCSREMFDYSTNQDEHLVSLFFRGGGSYLDASPSYWKSFEVKLKILDLEDFGLKLLPESIGTLIALRYLGLRNNYLKMLPHSLVCLKRLEVLDVAQNFVVEVPDIIWDMSSLRRVFMSSAIFQKPLNIDALKKLVTVMYISVDDLICELSSLQMMTILESLDTEENDGLQMMTIIEELSIEKEDDLQRVASLEELVIEEEDGLQTMTSLNKLGIEEVDATSDIRKLLVSLAEFDALEHLVLRGFRFRSMPCLDELRVLHNLNTLKLDGRLAKLPSVDNFPPGISYLRLVNTCLDEDPMPVLKQLPRLKHLKLRNAYTGQGMVISAKWSGSLDVLCIEELWNLRNLHVEKDALMWLKKLEIKNCPLLETLPEEIESMDGHQEFNMTTTKKIATKIRKSGLINKIRVVHINP